MTPETIETAFHCTRFNACLALLIIRGRGRWKLTSWGEWFEAYEIANPPLQED